MGSDNVPATDEKTREELEEKRARLPQIASSFAFGSFALAVTAVGRAIHVGAWTPLHTLQMIGAIAFGIYAYRAWKKYHEDDYY